MSEKKTVFNYTRVILIISSTFLLCIPSTSFGQSPEEKGFENVVTVAVDTPFFPANFVDKMGKPFVFQLNGQSWEKAMRAIGVYELFGELGFRDLGATVSCEEKRETMLENLDAWFSKENREHWVNLLRAADIVAAPINTMLEASENPDVLANGYLTEVEYPEFEKTVKVHGSPWKFSETPPQVGTAPKLGEHTHVILSELGYSDPKIQSLRDAGVV